MAEQPLSNNKIKNFFLHILSCCNKPEPSIQIGHPTDFRREDISLPGLTECEQAFIREKAIADAHYMVANQRCTIPPPSPSQFTMPHHSPALPQHQSTIDRVRRHARKLSAKMGYGGDPVDDEFASRPIVRPGEERYSGGGLAIRAGIVEGPPYAALSKDSITLNGGSEDSFHGGKDTPPRL